MDTNNYSIKKEPKSQNVILKLKPKKVPFIIKSMLSCALIVLVILCIFIAFTVGFGSSITIFSLLEILQNIDFAIFKRLFVVLFCLVPLCALIFKSVVTYLEYKNANYMIENEKIELQYGSFSLNCDNVYYHDIDSVRADVTLLDRILGVGTIIIYSDSKQYVLKQISNVYKITNDIQNIINEKKSDAFYPNSKR